MAKKIKNKKKRPFFFSKFPRYKEIQKYLRSMKRKFPKNVCVETIGKSLQGRDIDMIVISRNFKPDNQVVLIDAGIHAREWLSNTTALYIIENLLNDHKLFKNFDFYIIPCLNPDGYEYTHTCNRLWRKNMNTNSSRKERNWGVDLNRNFSYGYGIDTGSSNDTKSFMYRGLHALSEPEARGLASVMTAHKKHIKLYISLHCYGNVIMYPWSFTYAKLFDHQDLQKCGDACKNAMTACHRDRHFKVGSVASKMYLSSGSTADYARGYHDIKFAYTIELQKAGKSGFEPGTRLISPVGAEVTTGVTAMVKFVRRYYNRLKKKKTEVNPCKRRRLE